MKWIQKQEDFREQERIIEGLYYKDNSYPQRVFRPDFKVFICIDYLRVFTPEFIDGVKALVKEVNGSEFYFRVLEPSSEDYFFKHFGKYSALQFSVDDSTDVITDALYEDPGNPADALDVNSFRVVCFSKSDSWAFYGERFPGLGIFGLKEPSLRKVLTDNSPLDYLFPVQQAVDDYLKGEFASYIVPVEFREQILANYPPHVTDRSFWFDLKGKYPI